MPGPFTPDTSTGTLTVNGVSLHTYAWTLLDLRPLYMPASYRRSNVVIPGASGQRAYKYRVDQATHDLAMFVTGYCNQTGGVYSDPFVGYETNLRYLTSNLLAYTASATMNATLSVPSGTTAMTALVQVLGLDLGGFDPNNRFMQRAVLTVSIPAGRFA